jgi:hypothetical protein
MDDDLISSAVKTDSKMRKDSKKAENLSSIFIISNKFRDGNVG